MARSLPGLPIALLKRLLPRAEREEVLADVASEYHAMVLQRGRTAANRWLWRQTLHSAPSLLRWNWWRGTSGFEPPANDYREGGPMFKYLLADIRISARRLKARPAYSLLAITTLALGIGGTTAILGVARPLLIAPLPYANEREVAAFWFDRSWTEEEFTSLRGNFPGYRSVAAYQFEDVTLRDEGQPARIVSSIATSSELFDVLGATPLIGSGFRKGDDAIGAAPVAVLSYGMWQEMGGSASVIGSRITLDGTARTVIGVMPRGFWFPSPLVRVWLPQPINPEGRNGSFSLIGRVAPGQRADRMQPQVDALVKLLRERFTYPTEWDKTKDAFVVPLRKSLLGDLKPALVATIAAMGLILLIACTNVAALLLGQLETRAPELAVRTALGANRRRLAQPLIVEAMLLGLASAVVGVAIAAIGFNTLVGALPLGAFAESATFSWPLLIIAVGLAVLAALVVVLIPAAELFRREQGNLQGVLSNTRTGGVRGRAHAGVGGGIRLERVLVIVEVALAMLIASGSALLVRSVSNLYAIKPGLEIGGVAVLDAAIGNGATAAQGRAAFNELVSAFAALPGVKSVAFASKLPLRGNGHSFGITVEGQPGGEENTTFFRSVSLDYFRTMGIPLTRGRLFDAADAPDSTEALVIINEALAKKYFPGVDPLGRRIGGGIRRPQRIIGVVGDVAEGALLDPMKPARYYLATQVWFGGDLAVVVKTTQPEQAAPMLDLLRRTTNARTPQLAIRHAETMQDVFDTAVGPARQIMTLLTLLSSLALLLGAIGIYGVMSHFATRRKRDWAIRVALGLPGLRVVSQIVAQGALLIGIGVLLGGVLTTFMSGMLRSMLFNVGAADVVSFAWAAAAVLGAGLVAAFIPAQRAGRVDPAIVLRDQ